MLSFDLCEDGVLNSLAMFPDMRRDVQEIFRNTPHEKQVMMFSATLNKEIRPVCKKFMQDVISPFTTWPYAIGSGEASRRYTTIWDAVLGDSQRILAPLSIESSRNCTRGRVWG